jgi:hypothetical protein
MRQVGEFSLLTARSARAGAASLLWLGLSSTLMATLRRATRTCQRSRGDRPALPG